MKLQHLTKLIFFQSNNHAYLFSFFFWVAQGLKCYTLRVDCPGFFNCIFEAWYLNSFNLYPFQYEDLSEVAKLFNLHQKLDEE
jgi:hypothetical protein